MNLTAIFCPNLACPVRDQAGNGNIGVHSRHDPRFISRQCRKTFTTMTGTAFYRLRTSVEMVVIVVAILTGSWLSPASDRCRPWLL